MTVPECRSRKCVQVSCMVSQENKRGFCSGVLKEPYARTDPTDIIKLCFIENNRPHQFFLVTPAEALTFGSCLAWAYVEWLKQDKNKNQT